MFDISWGKLVIIGVVALIVIGPKELPGVLRQLGHWMTKIRRMASEFQGQFQEAMREAEMTDLKKQFDETTASIKSTFDTTEIKNELEKMIQDPAAASTPSSSTTTAPASDLPAPAQQTAATDPVALGTAPVAPPAADLSVPMPDLPPPPETKDFVDASTAPASPAAAPTPEPSEPKPVAAPEGGKAA